jgi:hypothetical protein
MSEVLAPYLELLRCPAYHLGKLNKGAPEAVWIEVRQTGTGKGFTKNFPGKASIAPVVP